VKKSDLGSSKYDYSNFHLFNLNLTILISNKDVFFNNTREHMTKIRNEDNRNVEKRHMEQFHKWFENEVRFIYYKN
jgi:hypothetical protein